VPRSRYYVGGAGAAPSTVPESIATLWNPHGTKALYVVSMAWARESGTGTVTMILIRVSARGTAGSTVTPDADNHVNRRASPASGAILDLADYTVAPTEEGPDLWRWHCDRPQSGIEVFFRQPIVVPAGTGLNLKEAAGTASPASVWFGWDE
jgi:hypothetical protein